MTDLPSMRLRAAAIAASGLAFLAGTASATPDESPSTYVAVHAGANALHHWSETLSFGGGIQAGGSMTLDRGLHAGLAVGRQAGRTRFEIEFQMGDFDLRKVRVGQVAQDVSAGGSYQAVTLNAYRVEPLGERWTAFAGAGVGYGAMSWASPGPVAGCNCFGEARDGGLVYQARIGTDYRVGQATRAFFQYTWMSMPGASAGTTPGVSYGRHGFGALTAGLRFTF